MFSELCNDLCLPISDRVAADRLRDRNSAAGIGDNAAWIGDNSSEIGDDAAASRLC